MDITRLYESRISSSNLDGEAMIVDKRYIALRQGLEQLSAEQLNRIISYTNQMVYDEFNFDESSGFY